MELEFESSVEQLEPEAVSPESPFSSLIENSVAQESLPASDAVLVASCDQLDSESGQKENIQEEAEAASASPLQQTLDQHLFWLETQGQAGHQANFSRSIISGSELTDANLREAILNKA